MFLMDHFKYCSLMNFTMHQIFQMDIQSIFTWNNAILYILSNFGVLSCVSVHTNVFQFIFSPKKSCALKIATTIILFYRALAFRRYKIVGAYLVVFQPKSQESIQTMRDLPSSITPLNFAKVEILCQHRLFTEEKQVTFCFQLSNTNWLFCGCT